MFLANPKSVTYEDKDWYFIKEKQYNTFQNATNGNAESWKIKFSGLNYNNVLDMCSTSSITITIIMKYNSKIENPRLFFRQSMIEESTEHDNVYRHGRA